MNLLRRRRRRTTLVYRVRRIDPTTGEIREAALRQQQPAARRIAGLWRDEGWLASIEVAKVTFNVIERES